MKIEATTLQEAITKASQEIGCSVVDLDIKVIQHPSKGLFGFFKKSAIIEARSEKEIYKKHSQKQESKPKKEPRQQEQKHVDAKPNEHKKSESIKSEQAKNEKKHSQKAFSKDDSSQNLSKKAEAKPEQKNLAKKDESKDKAANKKAKKVQQKPKTALEPKPKVDINSAIPQIEDGLKKLFSGNCFEIDTITVAKFEHDTVFIKLDGKDAALLIGKEGYRYKAFSYLLHNWINLKFGLSIRLEISEFLKNQEEMITQYLQDIIAKVKENGKAQTKPLDGILVKIALDQLRYEFPDKYVGIRSSRHGKFIVVSESKKSND
ncbi:Jag N-terminal domain-containing protein [Campylobacter geochelonis]|uniref:Jag N-terminal domain-containing protein n=1 Tax=Campylobacter geochelonis TaxID=1780362 RepID=UPI00077079FE|nr:Jag N-terminal domain-containing protein [Campylobacter geochelonis]CZE48771.1 spoIIIJ-associated protein [Campylobacter geochelonis]CZE51348.1 spoIIIJ-associated protein [Campylobacter geochelonis]